MGIWGWQCCKSKSDRRIPDKNLSGDGDKVGGMISPELLTVPDAAQGFYGKNAGDMIQGVVVEADGKVQGTLLKVEGYTGFSDVPEEQSGYYFPFVLNKKGTLMTFKKNGSSSKESIPWEADNVFRVEQDDTFEILVDGKDVVALDFSAVIFKG